MSGWLFVLPLGLACLFLAAFVISRVRQGAKIGATLRPMSGEDRLRVSLVVRSLEDAERELLKAAWIGNQPGHPRIGELLLDLKDLESRARRLLREY